MRTAKTFFSALAKFHTEDSVAKVIDRVVELQMLAWADNLFIFANSTKNLAKMVADMCEQLEKQGLQLKASEAFLMDNTKEDPSRPP